MKKIKAILTILAMGLFSFSGNAFATGGLSVSTGAISLTTGGSSSFTITASNAAGRVDVS